MTQAVEDRINDVSEKSLVLRGRKRKLATDVANNVSDATLEETMQGASDLSVELRDHDYKALNSGLFSERFFCQLDGASYRYVELSLISQFLLRVSFEHALIAEMREHTGNLKHVRGAGMNRAQFIHAMLKELKLPYHFVCPELNRTQKTPAPEQIKEEKTVKTGSQEASEALGSAGREQGVDAKHLTVKGKRMTAKQAKIINDALTAAAEYPGPKLARVAMVVSLIQESVVSDLNHPPDQLGPFSMIQSTVNSIPKAVGGIQKANGLGFIDPHDTLEVAAHYMTAGFTGAGGANALAKANPHLAPHEIASKVEGPEVTYPSSWNKEAEAIVNAFGSGGEVAAGEAGSGEATVATVRTATYEFSRGKPGEPEDTYTCALRLAEEVGWRFFVVGKRTIYFVNDEDLLKQPPRYTITPKSKGLVEHPTFDWEVGNRRVVEGGKRKPKPSEARLVVRANRYAAPPGTVIVFEGFGPADGKWLVDSVERSLYDAETTIQLRTPQRPLEEPQATESTSEPTNADQANEDLGNSASASRAVEAKIKSQHPELQSGVRKVVAIILTQFPSMTIGSTTNHSYYTTNGNKSLHVEGRAADLTGPNMDEVGSWIQKNIGSLLTEGIHNPTLSVKDGKAVPASGSFWGDATWAQHKSHIHVGV